MKAVILAGGLGTRISEETSIRPKPMVEIGGMPILWHIMKIYSSHGINDFIICLGYKGHIIKQYFDNYFLHMSTAVTYDFENNEKEVHAHKAEPWRVTLVETGLHTMTGGRLKKIRDYLDDDEPFCLTYGDGVTNANITEEIAFHKEHGLKATLVGVQPPGRFGAFTLHHGEGQIQSFHEKPDGDGAWINGGFFVLDPSVIDYVEGDSTVWEQEPMERLAEEGQMAAYRHTGFWQPMDTLRDKQYLESLWESGEAPWKVW